MIRKVSINFLLFLTTIFPSFAFAEAQYSWSVLNCKKISDSMDQNDVYTPLNYAGLTMRPHEKGGCTLTFELKEAIADWTNTISDYSTYDANLIPPNFIRAGCWIDMVSSHLQPKRSVVAFYEHFHKKWKQEGRHRKEILELENNKYKYIESAYSKDVYGPNNYEHRYECDLEARF